jgi:hypothetical protein
MKSQLLARSALAAALVVAVSACSEGLSSVNRNPNAPTDVDARFLLPQAIRSSLDDTRMQLAHTSIWSQHTVQIQYPDEERGQVRPGTIQTFWDRYYANALKDIQTVIAKGQENGRPNHEAVGLIWRAWLYHEITDVWGGVPYTQALRAEEGITTPSYDTQQAIYTSLFATLKAAEALLNQADTGFGSGDILYNNNFNQWRRFSQSLRMRLAMRLSEVAPVTAQAEFLDAFAAGAGGFQSNADNAMLRWPGSPYRQPLFENYLGRDDDGVSATMIDTLAALNDPRLQLYAVPAEQDGVYRGLRNNTYVPPLSIANYSRIGNFWRADGAATPTAIITYSEVLFLRAEAAERGWTTEVAATLYEQAIRANMNQWDAFGPANAPTDAEIDAYLLQPGIVYVPGATGRAQIQLQKWLALYMQGNEAYANQRRTDLPALTLGPDIPFRPVRFYYPEGEQSLNSSNMEAAVASQMPQGDAKTLRGRVWWDVVTPP